MVRGPEGGVKAWLISWQSANGRHPDEGKVVDILSARENAEHVRRYVERLYILHTASFDEMLDYARYRNPRPVPFQAEIHGDEIQYGHNPWLVARKVEDLDASDTAAGEEELTWTELDRDRTTGRWRRPQGKTAFKTSAPR